MLSRFVFFTGLLFPAAALVPTSVLAQQWQSLLDPELSKFEVFMGVPHQSVEGLPEGTFQSDDVRNGTPMGLGADVKNVYTVIEEDGQPVLKVTGEIYGGLTTLDEFSSYHFSTQVKWGEKKWPPRDKSIRDSGVLYHCFGKHGAFWNVWKAGFELQIQEGDFGDFIGLAGPVGQVRVSPAPKNNKRSQFDPESDTIPLTKYVFAWPEVDKPHGEWNLVEIYTLDATSVHVINGQIVMVIENAQVKRGGEPLTRGQLQIQSEGAEVFYKEMKIRPITEFPQSIASELRLMESPKTRSE